MKVLTSDQFAMFWLAYVADATDGGYELSKDQMFAMQIWQVSRGVLNA